MAAHSVVAARAQLLLHARARVALAGDIENYLVADANLAVFQGQQIQTAHHQVAAQAAGIQRRSQPQIARYRRQVLMLNERDLPLAVGLGSGMVTD